MITNQIATPTETKTTTWSFFFRRSMSPSQRKKGLTFDEIWKDRPTLGINVDIPTTITDPIRAIEIARKVGVPRGSNQSGVSEIQNHLGVWKHINDRRIDEKTVKGVKVTFKTWDELEEEDNGEN